MASSSSSSTARYRRRVALLRQPSREDNYEPPMRYCHHGLVAPRWTAWTDNNPGRRFYGCPNYDQDGGCGYFSWHDGDFGERANIVIKELLDDIDRLYDESSKNQRGEHGRRLSEELNVIHSELKKLKHRHELNDVEVRKRENKFRRAMLVSVMISVAVVVLYLTK
ncbi:uncharacterized protein LOC114757506 [Neltuma alba]|uniref:uncharacterized protein LOC114757506 n=1 Tax=Neltuma alba TaxID=207710 RepID=UPI0010A5349D|nr:uncharacterized protein LOC114757506 [Prosopis alba]